MWRRTNPRGMAIAAKKFEVACSPEEERELRARISLREDGIVSWHEVPRPSELVMRLFLEEILAKAPDGPVDLLIDLTDAGRPDAAAREGLRTLFRSIPNLGAVAAFTERNLVLNSAARFVLRKCCPGIASVHRTKEEAIDALGNARAGRRAPS